MNFKFLFCLIWSTLSLAAIVGIDLGHQFTKAMMVAPGLSFDIVFTDEGKRKDSSTIYLRPNLQGKDTLESADRVFGGKIGSLCSRFPEYCVSNVKNLLGKHIEHESVQQYLARHNGLTFHPDLLRNGSVLIQVGPSDSSFTFHAEEFMAMSLNELKDRVLKELASHPQAKAVAEDVAVSIAPYASQLSRIAYLDALHLANYSTVLGLVDEGTAVALGYLTNRRLDREDFDDKKVYHIIYDVGAGSTTATLFSYTPFKNQTIALDIESIGHDDDFGGEVLTKSVYDLLFSKFLESSKLPESTTLPPKLAARLWETSEKAKIILSANADYRVSLENFYDDADFKTTVTREEFELANADKLDRVSQPILDSLKNSPLGEKSLSEIQSVILNGGSTRTPFIQKQLTSLLGSEDKIAKVVNADEACALGTTVRGYLLKMINSNPYGIELNDRIFNSFGYSVDGGKTLNEVFARGSSSSNKTEVSLGAVPKGTVSIGLYENDDLFKLYSVKDLKKKADGLKCKKNTPAELVGTFSVDQNKMFGLSSLLVRCAGPEEVVEEPSGNATNGTASAKPKAKPSSFVLLPEPEYTHVKPLSKDQKKEVSKRLSHLKKKDLEKIEMDEIKNKLEASCYDLRSYLEDHEEQITGELGQKWFDNTLTAVGDTLEWLEFDSDNASPSDLKVKEVRIVDAKLDALNVVGMLDADLTLAGLGRINSDGLEVSSQVQSYLLEFGKQVKEVRDRYEKAGFDFDAENERIMKQIYGGSKDEAMKLDKHYEEFKDALKNVTELATLSQRKYDKISRREKFEKSDKVKKLIFLMMEDVLDLQEKHKSRIEYLLTKLQRLNDKREQQEKKQQKKAERDAKKKETETSEEPAETGSETTESASSTTASTTASTASASTASSATSTNEVHDEL